MTDRAQFEAMLEALINEDHEAAKEIFHNIVVGKSREIYEELLESDFGADQGNPYGKKEGEMEEEDDSMEEEESDDAEDDSADDSEDDGEEEEPGEFGDAEDDIDDAEDDTDAIEKDLGDEEDSEGDMEDRVMDLEDALEDLKAEFEQLLAGEEHEEENEPGIHGDGMPMHDLGAEMGGHDELDDLMEYTIKVGNPKHGDNGTNTRSTIDNMKNDMGGTAANIAQSFSTTTGGTKGGLAKPSTEDLTSGLGEIQNRPGISKSKSFTKKEPGHGPEKKGAGEKSVDAKSLISKRVR